MPLTRIELPDVDRPLPPEVASLLDDADERIDRYLRQTAWSDHGFVASDFVTVYQRLAQIAQANLAAGNRFCEWGSGFGVVAMLAAMAGFDACGIEVDYELVSQAEKFSEEAELEVEFVHGSFIPRGSEQLVEELYALDDEPCWLATDSDDAYEQLQLDIQDFDLIYAYPWPNESGVVEKLFTEHAADGALLLTYSHLDSLQLRRKT